MTITTVYHWSPRSNRESILKDGLKVLMSEIAYENPVTGKPEVWKPPYICTSPDPYRALRYVTSMLGDDPPELDLYQVQVSLEDQVKIRNDGTSEIIEVRVYNSIGASRIKYLATRS